MTWIVGAAKVIAINTAVLLALLLIAETGVRVASFARSCLGGACVGAAFVSVRIGDSAMNAVAPHPRLGFAPVQRWDGIMSRGKRVSIRDGFRSNGNESADGTLGRATYALVVGDSYAFGDEVADDETWVACLERAIGKPFRNGGVFGYGGAQSVLRAELELARNRYDVVIWSLLLVDDFPRDTRAMRFGAHGPRVIRKGGAIDFEYPLTKREARIDGFLMKYSKLWRYGNRVLAEYLVPQRNGNPESGRPVTASIDEILEFSVQRFGALPVEKKIIVFQYSPHVLVDPRAAVEREAVARLAAAHGIAWVDPAADFAAAPKEQIWIDGTRHYTPEGNRQVCDAIVRDIQF